jgi:2-polyprenyl-3-methyl-5-hydroxy-6-metoxy-1,4-benzoquinol methylase
MKPPLKRFLKWVLNTATRINNPMAQHEFFIPKLGLDVTDYIRTGNKTGVHHLLRYQWAMKTIADQAEALNILDVACGSGYGSFMLARENPSSQVTGLDYDPSAIKLAKKTYSLPNLQYQQGDILLWSDGSGETQFDCIISFDTLEHIDHREIMLERLVHHLKPAGSFLFSTPCGSNRNDLHPLWSYHKIEYSTASLYDFLKRYFKTICAPDMPGFPHREIFDVLNGTPIDYLLRLNPIICRDPIIFDNPYP